MPPAVDLSRKALRRDQILSIQFAPWPEPPPEMMRLPGVRQWWQDMTLARDRDIQTMFRMVNNLQIASNQATPEEPEPEP